MLVIWMIIIGTEMLSSPPSYVKRRWNACLILKNIKGIPVAMQVSFNALTWIYVVTLSLRAPLHRMWVQTMRIIWRDQQQGESKLKSGLEIQCPVYAGYSDMLDIAITLTDSRNARIAGVYCIGRIGFSDILATVIIRWTSKVIATVSADCILVTNLNDTAAIVQLR